jgi:hypothetical protein
MCLTLSRCRAFNTSSPLAKLIAYFLIMTTRGVQLHAGLPSKPCSLVGLVTNADALETDSTLQENPLTTPPPSPATPPTTPITAPTSTPQTTPEVSPTDPNHAYDVSPQLELSRAVKQDESALSGPEVATIFGGELMGRNLKLPGAQSQSEACAADITNGKFRRPTRCLIFGRPISSS